jgi:hypothetical protein
MYGFLYDKHNATGNYLETSPPRLRALWKRPHLICVFIPTALCGRTLASEHAKCLLNIVEAKTF